MGPGNVGCASVGATEASCGGERLPCRRAAWPQFSRLHGRRARRTSSSLMHALPPDIAPPGPPPSIAGAQSMAASLLFNLADATTATVEDAAGKSSWGFLAPISNTLEGVLKALQTGLDSFNVPYSYGFSIILLTLIVKVVTYPFTKKQVESSMASLALKPRINNIKKRYGEDKDRIKRETEIMYADAGVDPTAGCIPTLISIPILWGLFRTLSNVSTEGLLDNEGFFWIPSLAGPTSVAARQAGSGIEWLYPFVDGAPPIGWDEASRYLVLPVLVVVLQYIATSIIQPPVDPNDEENEFSKVLIALLPLLVGWFSLNVPSGLCLYYVSNTVITSAQQVWLRKLGGAEIDMKDLGPVTQLGMGRRTGEPVPELPPLPRVLAVSAPTAENETAASGEASGIADSAGVFGESADGNPNPRSENGASADPGAAAGAQMVLRRRCKRKKLGWTKPEEEAEESLKGA